MYYNNPEVDLTAPKEDDILITIVIMICFYNFSYNGCFYYNSNNEFLFF